MPSFLYYAGGKFELPEGSIRENIDQKFADAAANSNRGVISLKNGGQLYFVASGEPVYAVEVTH
jgi:hypothetical protein